mgnify:CR=1 FL=1
MTINEFAESRKQLFWSTKNYVGLSKEAVVETILNYGNWNDVKILFSILGITEVVAIFRQQTSRPRTNYRPEVANYFNLYFQKYASGSINR